jgi:hypothetical protein
VHRRYRAAGVIAVTSPRPYAHGSHREDPGRHEVCGDRGRPLVRGKIAKVEPEAVTAGGGEHDD